MHFDHALCASPQADALEWWVTNGIGGYAGGTVSGVLTRRYHGLLTAPLHPPLGRYLLITKADTVLLDRGKEIPLHTNRWRGGVTAPQGQSHIELFRLDGQMPVWEFAIEDLRIEQRVWMAHGQDQSQVGFRWKSGERETPPVLRIGLLANFRDHHGSTGPGTFEIHAEPLKDGLRLPLPNGAYIELHSPQGRFTQDHTWIENFLLVREQERGLHEIDHHLRVGYVEIPLRRDAWLGLSLSLGRGDRADLATSLSTERARIAALQESALPGVERDAVPDWVRQLVIAADSYLIQRREPDGSRKGSVIAGYPWFGDWGRDTMIALPGLTLATGRPQLAKEILDAFAGYLSRGMLPNVFPGSGETPEYNTVDAALWYIEAWRAYLHATADQRSLQRCFPVLAEIIQAYREGTRFGIRMDPADGLISAGVPGQQLTWMDARVNGREVTPRHGKPVEVSALWYNALRSMGGFARALELASAEYDSLANRVGEGFSRYWRGGDAGLYDVLDGPQGHESTIRPNQIFAVSLFHSPLRSAAQQRRVVDECREHLLTPFGLRALSPRDPRYQGHYAGGVEARDGAYHQGPVWGWLLGHYVLAESRVTGKADIACQRLDAMAEHLGEAGLGQLSEIFEGDPPHQPRGTPAQAWSVACTLEAWWRLMRDINRVRPR
ncbi:MAG: amylo-alpha-1,6-glucosidase [Gammaproteobacteria bacterium]|nr:amylo-alpha-1,6-glucosidase [Gammaproteobacteria bacterium]